MALDAVAPPAAPRLFVTGQLARAALERTLEAMAPPFPWKVTALRIKRDEQEMKGELGSRQPAISCAFAACELHHP